MKVVSLGPAFEPIFWKHVTLDIPHFFFFAFDWEHNKDETDILLAITGRHIDGMMLICKRRIVQLRGRNEAAQMLLEHLDLEEVELQASREHKQYVLEKYQPTWDHELMLMVLHKGQEELHTSHPVVKLEASDAPETAAILNATDPEFWGSITEDQIVEEINRVNWTGIRIDGELASICRTRLAEGIGHIATVATRETHRNKGYATTLVSHSVQTILTKTTTAMIYVLHDNQPAVKVYKRVGFKPYRTYYFIKGRKR